MKTSARQPRPVILGLLGGIGCGKSTIAAWLKELGAVVLDADRIVRELLTEPGLRDLLARRYGPGILAPDGTVDRGAVASAVFGDAQELQWLEGELHPRVIQVLEEQLLGVTRERSAPAVVLDVPLLLEKGDLKKRCDLLIFVDCPAETRRKRVEERRAWSPAEFKRREQHQLPPEEKRKHADVVLLNQGTLADLRRQLDAWLEGSGGLSGLPRRAPS